MTYVPTAYAKLIQNQYWIVLNTPSGIGTRLHMTYPSKSDAEAAIAILGFRLIEPPRDDIVTTLRQPQPR